MNIKRIMEEQNKRLGFMVNTFGKVFSIVLLIMVILLSASIIDILFYFVPNSKIVLIIKLILYVMMGNIIIYFPLYELSKQYKELEKE